MNYEDSDEMLLEAAPVSDSEEEKSNNNIISKLKKQELSNKKKKQQQSPKFMRGLVTNKQKKIKPIDSDDEAGDMLKGLKKGLNFGVKKGRREIVLKSNKK